LGYGLKSNGIAEGAHPATIAINVSSSDRLFSASHPPVVVDIRPRG